MNKLFDTATVTVCSCQLACSTAR